MDITKCNGANCPIKNICRRFIEPVRLGDGYFTKSPIVKIRVNYYKCEYCILIL